MPSVEALRFTVEQRITQAELGGGRANFACIWAAYVEMIAAGIELAPDIGVDADLLQCEAWIAPQDAGERRSGRVTLQRRLATTLDSDYIETVVIAIECLFELTPDWTVSESDRSFFAMADNGRGAVPIDADDILRLGSFVEAAQRNPVVEAARAGCVFRWRVWAGPE
jgi:hypothetical protein